jgi:hypothetical protein
LPTELKHTHLTRELAERLLHVGADVPGLLVLAPVVGRDLGELFAAARINVMDLAGKEDVPLVEDFPLVPEEETPKFDHLAMTLQLRMVRAMEHWRGQPRTLTEIIVDLVNKGQLGGAAT